MVVAGLFGIVRENHGQDVSLDARCCHGPPDVSVLAAVESSRIATLRVQDDFAPVIEHRVLADAEVGLARCLVLQLAQGPEPKDCHVA